MEGSKGLRESLTYAKESSNVLGKMMTIFNTDLQHDEFLSWFSILMLMYFMLLLPFFGGAIVPKRFVTTSFQLLACPFRVEVTESSPQPCSPQAASKQKGWVVKHC